MAAPNIKNLTGIFGKTEAMAVTTSATEITAHPGSGYVIIGVVKDG